MGNREFIYWKRPWHKWAIIIGAFSQLLCLWMNVREYSRIARAGVLSAEQWASYALTAQWQCAVNGVAAACFLGIFLIGTFARSKKEARLFEGLFLLLLALAWGAAALALHPFSSDFRGAFWAILFIIALGGAAHSLSQYRKE